MERRTAYRRTTRFILGCAAVLAGLAWARLAGEISGWWPLVFGLFALLSFRQARLMSVYAIIIFGFSIGWWRGGQYMTEINFLDSISRQQVTLTGRVLNDSLYDDRGALSFDLGYLQLETSDGPRRVVGKVGVSGYGEKNDLPRR